MASTLSLLFLFLLILLSFSLSTAPAASPPRTPPLRRRPAPQHILRAPASQPTPPPPPPDHQMDDNIIDAMIGSGDFGNWINLLMSAGSNSSSSSSLNTSATLFIPDDVALPQAKKSNPNYPNQIDFDPFLFAYHVVPRRLSFSDLRALTIGSRLPTLLPGNSLLLTNNSLSNFTVNDSPITHPDLYLNAAISVQGIGEAFDYKRFGVAASLNRPDQNPPPPPPSPRLIRRPPPPYRTREADPGFRFLPGEIAVSEATRSGSDFWISLVLVVGIVVIKAFLASIH